MNVNKNYILTFSLEVYISLIYTYMTYLTYILKTKYTHKIDTFVFVVKWAMIQSIVALVAQHQL